MNQNVKLSKYFLFGVPRCYDSLTVEPIWLLVEMFFVVFLHKMKSVFNFCFSSLHYLCNTGNSKHVKTWRHGSNKNKNVQGSKLSRKSHETSAVNFEKFLCNLFFRQALQSYYSPYFSDDLSPFSV